MKEVINAIMSSVIMNARDELTPIARALVDSRGSDGLTAAESLINTIVCRLARENTVEETVQFVMSHDVSPIVSEQISKLVSAIATKCIVEICAVNEAIVEERRGVSPKQILKEIKKRIKEKSYCVDCMPNSIDPNREEEFDDHDPVNGRYVNVEDEALLLQADAATTE